MGTTNSFVEKADTLAGITTLILVALGVIQIILGEFYLKSVALTANGIDCIGDGFVSGVVWVGLLFFKKPADDKFHYGYYKMENFASILAAIVMMILAGYIIIRSYLQFIDPHTVNAPLFGAVVALAAAIIALSLGGYKYYREKKSHMGSVRLEAFNTIKDGVASGLTVVALIFDYYGFFIADAIVGMIIAGIIITIGFAAIKESSLMLVDHCDGMCLDHRDLVKQIAESVEEVHAAHIVRLRRTGPVLQGEVEIEVAEDMPVKELKKIKKEIVKRVKQSIPDIENLTVTPHIEDDELQE